MSPDALPDFSLVLPFYNEEEGAEKVITDLRAAFDAEGFRYELVLVDNGSVDGTGQILARHARSTPSVTVVTVPQNKGYGWGIRQGLEAARGARVGYMCADGQIAPPDILKVYREHARGAADIVKVQRVTRSDGFQRKVVSWVYNIVFSALFGTTCPDLNGTPKVFGRALLAETALESDDWFIDAELILKATAKKRTIKHVPVDFLPRVGGKSNVRLGTLWEFAKNILRYRIKGAWQG